MAMVQCPNCKSMVDNAEAFCPNCGTPTAQPMYQQPTYTVPQQNVYVTQPQPQGANGLGIAGFVLSLIALIFCWNAFIAWLCIPGLGLSIGGMFMKNRGKGLAIAGLVCGGIALLVWIIVAAAIGSVL